jgi:hypothetical protein
MSFVVCIYSEIGAGNSARMAQCAAPCWGKLNRVSLRATDHGNAVPGGA